MHNWSYVAMPGNDDVIPREKCDNASEDDNRPTYRRTHSISIRTYLLENSSKTVFVLAIQEDEGGGAHQFIDVPVGFGWLGKNWKIHATRRKDIAITLTKLPALPRRKREVGNDSPRRRLWRIPALCG